MKCSHGENWIDCFRQALAEKQFPDFCIENIISRMRPWFCKRFKDREDVEDLVQEFSLALSQYYSSFDLSRPGTGKSYVFAIARNICIQHLKKKAMINPVSDLEKTDEGMYNLIETQEAVKHCIDLLEPKWKKVIIFRDIEGLSLEEIAEKTNIPIRSQHYYRRKAYESLKKCLEQQGFS